MAKAKPLLTHMVLMFEYRQTWRYANKCYSKSYYILKNNNSFIISTELFTGTNVMDVNRKRFDAGAPLSFIPSELPPGSFLSRLLPLLHTGVRGQQTSLPHGLHFILCDEAEQGSSSGQSDRTGLC